jgi:hypothetical protein
MNQLQHTQLESGEKIVFGPVTSTKTVSAGGSGPGQGGSVSHVSGRLVCVTNERIIIEDLQSAERTRIIPNGEIRQVFVKRKVQQGRPSLAITKAVTKAGQSVKLDIKWLPEQDEAIIQDIFADAEVAQEKGSKVPLIVAAVVVGLGLLVCVGPMLVSLVLRLFSGGA